MSRLASFGWAGVTAPASLLIRCARATGAKGQVCVDDPPRQPVPLAAAMEWVAKITTVALEMFLPAVGGAYLDRRWGTNFWALVGLVLGVTVGMWHLLRMTQPRKPARPPTNPRKSDRGSAGRPGP